MSELFWLKITLHLTGVGCMMVFIGTRNAYLFSVGITLLVGYVMIVFISDALNEILKKLTDKEEKK